MNDLLTYFGLIDCKYECFWQRITCKYKQKGGSTLRHGLLVKIVHDWGLPAVQPYNLNKLLSFPIKRNYGRKNSISHKFHLSLATWLKVKSILLIVGTRYLLLIRYFSIMSVSHIFFMLLATLNLPISKEYVFLFFPILEVEKYYKINADNFCR